ncbi:XRE family transcriptional regulator [Leptospira langatensis]|uniref:XRE family transcriptional regulator n=1 Tax=Leptospira langatensis TaxID=2484983 RepID=A0A5R2ATI6_9LEPT|nr:helix-turn-helix transcriptional regulator [Leptospira langatensis]TGJ99880.1 XRE family transcriptional regulator [Leptospira langatensis]
MSKEKIPKLFPAKVQRIVDDQIAKNSDLKQKDIASKLEQTPAGLSHILTGKTKTPSRAFLSALRREYHVDPNWVMDDLLPVDFKRRYLSEGKGAQKSLDEYEELWKAMKEKGCVKEMKMLLLEFSPKELDLTLNLIRKISSSAKS